MLLITYNYFLSIIIILFIYCLFLNSGICFVFITLLSFKLFCLKPCGQEKFKILSEVEYIFYIFFNVLNFVENESKIFPYCKYKYIIYTYIYINVRML